MKIPIFVAGYPKSGTTWLTRLLGEVLHSPTGGSIPRLDNTEIATEGQDRVSNYVIRKGHFVIDQENTSKWGTRAHLLSPNDLTIFQAVHIVRDPRDIAVSAAFHWSMSMNQIVHNMIKGSNNFRFCGPWAEYVDSWIDVDPAVLIVRYEDLLLDGITTISRILREFEITPNKRKIEEAYEKQKFSVRKAHVEKFGASYPLGLDFNVKFMRKGESGDWVNYFNKQLAFEAEVHFGSLLRKFGYESDINWWNRL